MNRRPPKCILGRLREIPVDMGMFGFVIWCVIGPKEDLLAYVNWRHDAEDFNPLPEASGLHFSGPGNADTGPVIWIGPRAPRSAQDIGTLAHEAVHAVREMMQDWAKMQINADTQEVLAHGVHYVVETVLKEVRK
jgi:hypothetical protein